MLSLPANVRVFAARDHVDLRKGSDGLHAIVRDEFGEDALSGNVYVFFNARRDRVKLLVWDRNGFWLLYKRLERGTFQRLDGTTSNIEIDGARVSELRADRSARHLFRQADRAPPMTRTTHLLHVPVIGQSTDFGCGNTSLAAVVQYFGRAHSPADLAALAGTTTHGTDHENLIAAAVATGAWVFAKPRGTLRDLEGWISRGLPVIVGWWSMGPGDKEFDPRWTLRQRRKLDCGHYSVIRGVTPTGVLMMDPQEGDDGRTIGYCEKSPSSPGSPAWERAAHLQRGAVWRRRAPGRKPSHSGRLEAAPEAARSTETGLRGTGSTRPGARDLPGFGPNRYPLSGGHPLGVPIPRVLALTKMHGSRRRMDAKLDLEIRPAKADCQTIDGFALHLNRRWRDLAESTSSTRLPDELDFKGQSELAGQLLALDVVATWVARTYPIVVVDELQDSKDGQIRILEGLSRATRCVCAADEFQDLTGDAGSNASAWARGRCTPVILTGSHRTTVNGILDAADALRSSPPGSLVVAKGFRMSAVASAAQAGAYLSWEITSARSEGCTSAVVLTPTSKEKSAFVRDAVEWVRTKTATSSKGSSTSGPFKIEWESGAHSEVEELVALLKLTADAETQVNVRGLDVAARSVGAGDVAAGLQRRRTLTGSETIGSAEGYRLVDRALSMRRSFGVTRSSRLSAMTVHQAKNREFDAVVVLWPRKIRKDPEMQRRLLYNAITRARRRVLVLLEDSKRERIIAPPFVAP